MLLPLGLGTVAGAYWRVMSTEVVTSLGTGYLCDYVSSTLQSVLVPKATQQSTFVIYLKYVGGWLVPRHLPPSSHLILADAHPCSHQTPPSVTQRLPGTVEMCGVPSLPAAVSQSAYQSSDLVKFSCVRVFAHVCALRIICP